MSITTRVPSSAGMLATVSSSVRPSARFQLSDGACLYAAHTWYGNSRALATSSASVILAMTASIAASRDAGLVEVAQVAHERHHAHRRDDRLPRLGVHAARQPARQPLPREAGLGERGRAAGAQHRAALVRPGRRRARPRRRAPAARSASATASSWWRRSSRYLNSADWRSSRGDGWVSSMTSAMRTWRDRPS